MSHNAFYAAALTAVAAGVYLFQLWSAERQIELHSLHLLEALEENDASGISDFVAETYQDDWGHDKALLLERLRQIAPSGRDGRLVVRDAAAQANGGEGEWRARITIETDANELTAPMIERVNSVPEPFVLRWRRESWKPWDWKLARVSNPSFELPRELRW